MRVVVQKITEPDAPYLPALNSRGRNLPARRSLRPWRARLSEWAHLDITVRQPPTAAHRRGSSLLADLPASAAGTARIELQLDAAVVGTATVLCCPACRSATLGYVHVVAGYRRLGYRRMLVTSTRACLPEYRWTPPLPDGVVAQAFRSRIPYPPAGLPCVHQTSRMTTEAGRRPRSAPQRPVAGSKSAAAEGPTRFLSLTFGVAVAQATDTP